ncbi:hypothetical protein ABS858_24035, partial [Vibrio neptunius]
PNVASVNTGKRSLVEYQLKEARGDYFNDYYKKDYAYYKMMFDKDGDYSLWSYSRAVFAYGTKTQQKFLVIDLIVSGVSLSLAILFSFVLFKMPRPADIYFDRKRGIVYTW